MSEQCHVCGPVKHECPTVVCAPCALQHAHSDEALRRLEELVDAIRIAEAIGVIDAEGSPFREFKPFVDLGWLR